MAKFCSDECKEQGSICDFCKHYSFKEEWCFKLGVEREPCDGYKCDDFECTLVGLRL